MTIVKRLHFSGHKNISSTHYNTFALTTDPSISPNGDCFVGIELDTPLSSFSEEEKTLVRNANKLRLLIEVDNFSEEILAIGHGNMQLSHPKDLVVRKSRHICEKTLAILANKAANDFNKDLVEALQSGKKGTMIIEVIS